MADHFYVNAPASHSQDFHGKMVGALTPPATKKGEPYLTLPWSLAIEHTSYTSGRAGGLPKEIKDGTVTGLKGSQFLFDPSRLQRAEGPYPSSRWPCRSPLFENN